MYTCLVYTYDLEESSSGLVKKLQNTRFPQRARVNTFNMWCVCMRACVCVCVQKMHRRARAHTQTHMFMSNHSCTHTMHQRESVRDKQYSLSFAVTIATPCLPRARRERFPRVFCAHALREIEIILQDIPTFIFCSSLRALQALSFHARKHR